MEFEAPPTYEAFAVMEDQVEAKRKGFPKLVAGFEWLKWLSGLTTRMNQAPVRATSVHLTAQAASIATTPLPLGSVAPGLYRVSYYFRITTPATSSSSLTFTLAWTDGTVTQSASGAAETGNSTGDHQFGTLIIRSDESQPISYSTTYASSGATPMQYRLDIVIEELKAEAA